MAELDLIVRGGRVIDGSGEPERTADIAIKDGKIESIGKVSGKAKREIDANGALVTPGFVDIHTHYDGQVTWSNRLNPSSHHGVTTVVMGNCGVGFAPVRPTDHDLLIKLMEGVEDIPGIALHEGLPWAWESFPDYLDYLDQRAFDMDVGAQLPHAAVRVYVMGERGANRDMATGEDIAEMRRLTTEAIKAGALGFTSSRTLNHRSSSGDPTPSLTAARNELVGIGQGIKDAGRGVLEMISDFKDLDEEFASLMAMTQASGTSMTISLAQGINPQGWKILLDRIDEANKRGIPMKGQVAPRAIGILLGLNCTLNPFIRYPSYREIADLPLNERVNRLLDASFRQKLLSEDPKPGGPERLLTSFERMWVLGDTPNYEPDPRDSIAATAERQGVSPQSLTLDAMLYKDGEQILYTPFANYAESNLDCCREMILAENTVMGLGDGGAHVGTICDASFVTYLLTHWGRDRIRGELIDLPTLVKAQSADTAAAVGLLDRGLLMPGKRADLNVIDFDNLKVHTPTMVHDLPAGKKRLEQTTEGYLATICHGEVTYENGVATNALPGRLVRGQQA
ncbi:MAG: amidohydrolase family protein [bacterium]|nr:D-aminoacylase [Gammaproteobacteria bacterium]HIL96178.1 D-aminoacylase [Pseudomonadales bacterium]